MKKQIWLTNSLLLPLIAFLLAATPVHATQSCLTSIEPVHVAAHSVLAEIAQMRDAIHLAGQDGSAALGHTLAKTYAQKLTQAEKMGVPLSQLAQYRKNQTKIDQDDRSRERERKRIATEEESRFPIWKESDDFNDAKDALVLAPHPNNDSFVQVGGNWTTYIVGAKDRSVRIPLTHTDPLAPELSFSASYSGDGKRIIAVHSSRDLSVYDSTTGTRIGPVKGPDVWATRAVLNFAGDTILEFWRDHRILTRDAVTGKTLHFFGGEWNDLNRMSFSPDGNFVLIQIKSKVTIWDSKTGRHLWDVNGTGQGITSVRGESFSPDSKYVFVQVDDFKIAKIDLATGTVSMSLIGHSEDTKSISFSTKAHPLLTLDEGNTLNLWDDNSGALLQSFKDPSQAIIAAQFIPGSRQFLTVHSDASVSIWDTDTFSKIQHKKSRRLGPVSEASGAILQFGNDSSVFVLTIPNAGRTVWQLNSPQHSSETVP